MGLHGFSGAPVFLLGGDHNMQLIAIHAGYSSVLDSNFGFLIASELKRYENKNVAKNMAAAMVPFMLGLASWVYFPNFPNKREESKVLKNVATAVVLYMLGLIIWVYFLNKREESKVLAIVMLGSGLRLAYMLGILIGSDNQFYNNS